ncbi:hypothetical protein H8959_018351 [Pygathrix nigripes]
MHSQLQTPSHPWILPCAPRGGGRGRVSGPGLLVGGEQVQKRSYDFRRSHAFRSRIFLSVASTHSLWLQAPEIFPCDPVTLHLYRLSKHLMTVEEEVGDRTWIWKAHSMDLGMGLRLEKRCSLTHWLHSGKKLELGGPGNVCCVVRQRSKATRQGWKPALYASLPQPSPGNHMWSAGPLEIGTTWSPTPLLPLSSYPLTPMLLAEKLELAARIQANVGGLDTLMAILATKVLTPTELLSSR